MSEKKDFRREFMTSLTPYYSTRDICNSFWNRHTVVMERNFYDVEEFLKKVHSSRLNTDFLSKEVVFVRGSQVELYVKMLSDYYFEYCQVDANRFDYKN